MTSTTQSLPCCCWNGPAATRRRPTWPPQWLARLPAGQTYTAERAAYRNLLLGLMPPQSAWHRNPYREWIGALIRVDAYAYASPGDPVRAAELAARDASVSHVGNGVAAAMWAAAMISLALVGVPPSESVPMAAEFVPEGSRLHVALSHVIGLHREGRTWEESIPEVIAASAHYSWVHAIPNAAIIASSLLWGDGDYERSVTLAVAAGFDTDSNGATVGSAAGALRGCERPAWGVDRASARHAANLDSGARQPAHLRARRAHSASRRQSADIQLFDNEERVRAVIRDLFA